MFLEQKSQGLHVPMYSRHTREKISIGGMVLVGHNVDESTPLPNPLLHLMEVNLPHVIDIIRTFFFIDMRVHIRGMEPQLRTPPPPQNE